MDVRLTWTDCDETGDHAVPSVLSPRDLFSRPENMDETALHMNIVDLEGVDGKIIIHAAIKSQYKCKGMLTYCLVFSV